MNRYRKQIFAMFSWSSTDIKRIYLILFLLLIFFHTFVDMMYQEIVSFNLYDFDYEVENVSVESIYFFSSRILF
jgi:hypothetical protein